MRKFYIDGTSSDTYNIYASGENSYNAAERNVESISVPGRNGDLLIDNGTFKNIDVTYPCVIPYGFKDNANAIRSWLMSNAGGYHKITDDYDANHYRMGRYKGGIEFQPMYTNQAAALCDITFDCKPQRFLASGENEIQLSNGQTVVNPTQFESHPTFRVYGTGYVNVNGRKATIYGSMRHDELIDGFVARMNEKAADIGMTNTVFNSPSGLPRINSRDPLTIARNSKITAKDTIRLLIEARYNQDVYSIMGTDECIIHIDGGAYIYPHNILTTKAWQDWEDATGYKLIAAKGGSLTGIYGEIGNNGILNYALIVSDGVKDYAIAILGLTNTNSDTDLAKIITIDLITLLNDNIESGVIHNAASRQHPVCMGIVEITDNKDYDIAHIENGAYYHPNDQRASASIAKIMMALLVTEKGNTRTIGISDLDCVGGKHANNIYFGRSLGTVDALQESMLISDNYTATALARDCYDDRTDYIDIDSDMLESSANNLVSIDNGFGFDGDNNSITLSGGITSATAVPRWWEL